MSQESKSSVARVAAVLLVIALVAACCFVVLGATGRLSMGFFADAAGAYATAPVVVLAHNSKAIARIASALAALHINRWQLVESEVKPA